MTQARSKQQLLLLHLPKWPQMLVTGKSLSADQAKEIIRRTDSFFGGHSGNDHVYNAQVKQALGMPLHPQIPPVGAPTGQYLSDLECYWAQERAFRKRWGYVETEYVTNDWISCSFIYGPHGWCHPDGTIGYIDNVGKWPAIADVLMDWETLARAFPFIQCGITLMSDESFQDDSEPVVSILVEDGQAALVDPLVANVHAGHLEATRRPGSRGQDDEPFLSAFDLKRECCIPSSWIADWAQCQQPAADAVALATRTN